MIDKVVPIKESRIKDNLQEWFTGEIWGAIKNFDKLFRIFKRSKSSIVRCKKESNSKVTALKISNTVQHDANLILGWSKNYYVNLAGNHLK